MKARQYSSPLIFLSDAEALCDHVAIINKGELQGVGAVADLTSSVHSKVELVWQGRRCRHRCGRWERSVT